MCSPEDVLFKCSSVDRLRYCFQIFGWTGSGHAKAKRNSEDVTVVIPSRSLFAHLRDGSNLEHYLQKKCIQWPSIALSTGEGFFIELISLMIALEIINGRRKAEWSSPFFLTLENLQWFDRSWHLHKLSRSYEMVATCNSCLVKHH